MSTPVLKAKEAILSYCRERKLVTGARLFTYQVQEVALTLEPFERNALLKAIEEMVAGGIFRKVKGELGVDLELTEAGSATVYSGP